MRGWAGCSRLWRLPPRRLSTRHASCLPPAQAVRWAQGKGTYQVKARKVARMWARNHSHKLSHVLSFPSHQSCPCPCLTRHTPAPVLTGAFVSEGVAQRHKVVASVGAAATDRLHWAGSGTRAVAAAGSGCWREAGTTVALLLALSRPLPVLAAMAVQALQGADLGVSGGSTLWC